MESRPVFNAFNLIINDGGHMENESKRIPSSISSTLSTILRTVPAPICCEENDDRLYNFYCLLLDILNRQEATEAILKFYRVLIDCKKADSTSLRKGMKNLIDVYQQIEKLLILPDRGQPYLNKFRFSKCDFKKAKEQLNKGMNFAMELKGNAYLKEEFNYFIEKLAKKGLEEQKINLRCGDSYIVDELQKKISNKSIISRREIGVCPTCKKAILPSEINQILGKYNHSFLMLLQSKEIQSICLECGSTDVKSRLLHQAHKICDICLLEKFRGKQDIRQCPAMYCHRILSKKDVDHIAELKKQNEVLDNIEPIKKQTIVGYFEEKLNKQPISTCRSNSPTIQQDLLGVEQEPSPTGKKSGFFGAFQKAGQKPRKDEITNDQTGGLLGPFPLPPVLPKIMDKRSALLKKDEGLPSPKIKKMEERKSNRLIIASNSNIFSSNEPANGTSPRLEGLSTDEKQKNFFKCNCGHWFEPCDFEEQYTFCINCNKYACRLCRTLFDDKKHNNDCCKKIRREVIFIDCNNG